MGRHHDRKYGYGTGMNLRGPAYGRYGMRRGGLGAGLLPLIGLGAVLAIIYSFWQKRRFGYGGLGWSTSSCTACL
jgi:hypothetical protein